jgi:hypothetical protein
MSSTKASKVLSSIVAALAMTIGLLAFSAGAASATPGDHTKYPPVPPSVVVNKGVVKYGMTVKVSGKRYTAKEKVFITVYLIPKGSTKVKVVKTATVTAGKTGTFSLNIKMAKPGHVVITARGKSSKKLAGATVWVIDKKKGGGGWNIKPVSYTTGLTGSGSTLTPVAANNSNGPALAAAAIGVFGLAGSASVTRRTMRRRKMADAA